MKNDMVNYLRKCLDDKLSGSSYVPVEELRGYFLSNGGYDFDPALSTAVEQGYVAVDEYGVSPYATMADEEWVARKLAQIWENPSPLGRHTPSLGIWETILNEEQKLAVETAFSSRLCCITGGPGTGKTDVIKAIASISPWQGTRFLAVAPTGKAAYVLRDRANIPAKTIHKALGSRSESRSAVNLLVVDEASMVNLQLFRWILEAAGEDTRVVLVGDPRQLPPIGCGSALEECIRLGFPTVRLRRNYRQNGSGALSGNISSFFKARSSEDLGYDDSFRLEEVPEENIQGAVTEEAVRRYEKRESVMVLTPYNTPTPNGALRLNGAIRSRLARADAEKTTGLDGRVFLDGDRILLTSNRYREGFWNGDVGELSIADGEARLFLDDGRVIPFQNAARACADWAYAFTVHKAQGSQCDTVVMPLSMAHVNMLGKNLLYTAVSRARKQVILIGDRAALDLALQSEQTIRKTRIYDKVKNRAAMAA